MLDVKEHARIISDIDHICEMAGIQSRYLHCSMTEYCGSSEVDWVRRFRMYREAGCPGLVLVGVSKPDTRCQAMAAALLRNFIDARVIPVNTLLEQVQEHAVVSPTVLLIPNFFVVATSKTPGWRIQALYDLLLRRSTQNKPTVVYVEEVKALVAVYGTPFQDFLDGFRVVTDGDGT